MKPIRLFSTDLDGTVVGNNDATARFRDFWQSLPQETRPLLVFNSGRLLDDQFELMEDVPLPNPDYVIGGVGTLLSGHDQPSLKQAYAASLGQAFDTHKIVSVMSSVSGASVQPARYQHDLKSSWYLHDASGADISDIERRLVDNEIDARIVYSSNRDLDILPRAADKGAAIQWLCIHLDIGLDEVVVAGDTGNDRAMFELPGVRGIVVSNALPELKGLAVDKDHVFCAPDAEADGVMSGLRHWLSL
ncbi:HAD-IIB family hydrolase [Agrobacterium bohemicum]|uniref:Mannosylfructose-phosphate phosphatase n=1 Tax=Agrobacterium bohemicum TaxID=2052828 RepID=A0A135NZK4_9HYPH|nr:HAD-IIB family hydrolase [Agrobacterium bohemicum]KXG84611.1 mannosylfructose-phosphate phosphatase [Agrobacterium bohemicum]